MTNTLSKPPITISDSDHTRLLRLAEILVRNNRDLAEQLFAELERAELIPDDAGEHEVVRMGSTLGYETDSGEARAVTLVFPQDEDIDTGRISILTPIGVALIGLAVGDSIDWQRRDGRVQRLTVRWIATPAAAKGASSGHAVTAS